MDMERRAGGIKPLYAVKSEIYSGSKISMFDLGPIMFYRFYVMEGVKQYMVAR